MICLVSFEKMGRFPNIRYDFLVILFYHKSRSTACTYEEERIVESVNKIRIGIIGAGNIGGVHIREFSKLADLCEITAITDAYLPLAEAKAQEHGIAYVAATPEELIQSRMSTLSLLAYRINTMLPLLYKRLKRVNMYLLRSQWALMLQRLNKYMKRVKQSIQS